MRDRDLSGAGGTLSRKTVAFGPFVGEFGWEHSYWRAWVEKACRTRFKEWRRIAISYPGRQPFYPAVDEFWPLPQWFLDQGYAARNYVLDDWWESRDGRLAPHVACQDLVGEFRRRLPPDAVLVCPFRLNRDGQQGGMVFGQITFSLGPFRYCKPVPIPISRQDFMPLEATPEGFQLLRQRYGPIDGAMTVFPRYRSRRPDKNWPLSDYIRLVEQLHTAYPARPILITGSPDGAYPFEAFPGYCMDLINVEEERRLDIQVAALKRSAVGIGATSGGLLVALSAGCPVVEWGEPHKQTQNFEHNVFQTDLVYVQDEMPTPDEVFTLVADYLEGKIAGSVVYPAERRRSRENPYIERASLLGSVTFKLAYHLSKVYLAISRRGRQQ